MYDFHINFHQDEVQCVKRIDVKQHGSKYIIHRLLLFSNFYTFLEFILRVHILSCFSVLLFLLLYYYCSGVNLRPGKVEYHIGILPKGSGKILSNIIYCYLVNLYEEQWAGSTFGCSHILWYLSKLLTAKSHLSRFAFANQQLQVLWKTKHSRTERSLTPPRGWA